MNYAVKNELYGFFTDLMDCVHNPYRCGPLRVGMYVVHLKLESLELRCLYNNIIMVYKIVHKLTSLNDDVLLSYHIANYNYHVLTRGHILKLKKNAFRLDVARNHFCNRVVSAWNGLPEHVTAASLNTVQEIVTRHRLLILYQV